MKKTIIACAIVWSSVAVARPYVIEDDISHQKWIQEQKEQLEQIRKDNLSERKKQDYQISIGSFYSYNKFNNHSFSQGFIELYPQPKSFLVKSPGHFISFERRLSDILGLGIYAQKTSTPTKNFKIYIDNPPLTEFELDAQNINGISLSETNIIAYVRQYVAPDNSFDPYIEVGMGHSNQHGILELTDHREYTKHYKNPFVTTIGVGVQKFITDSLSWTASLSFRNQKCAKFYTPESLNGSFDYYRAYDFKLALTYGW